MLRKLSVIKLLFIVKIVSGLETENFTNYLKQYQKECILSQNVYSCIKYKALSQVTKLGDQIGAMGNGSEMFKLVDINGTGEEINEVLTSRKMNHNLGFLDYLKSQLLSYLSKKAVSIQIPEGVQLISDDDSDVESSRRRRRHKQKLLIPIISIALFFKIKLIASLILSTLLFIKKLFFIGYIVLPSLLNRKCPPVYHKPVYYYGHHHYRKHSLDDPIIASTNNHEFPGDVNYEQQYRKYLKLYTT